MPSRPGSDEAVREPLLPNTRDETGGDEAEVVAGIEREENMSHDKDGKGSSVAGLLVKNLGGGGWTWIAQAGLILFVITVWVIIIASPAGLFSYHPPLQTLSILFFVQGVLVLQPTKTPADKKTGLNVHLVFQLLGLAIAVAGVSVMIYNKAIHNAAHFASWHGLFGIITASLLLLQSVFGLLVVYDPGLTVLGGEARAKLLWKYHRAGGYLILPLALFTSLLALSSADWVLQHSSASQRAAAIVGLLLIVIGLSARVKLSKMQFRRTARS